jgi:hypothetical protein
MLDFPASPSVGQKYPASPIAGIPQYTWDGEKWTTQGGSIVSATPGTALPLMDAKPALVGVSTNFSREDHVHPVDTKAVRSDVATLWTPAQQQLARQNAYAAPFDAMAYGGMQINGGFEVSQEKGGGGTSTSGVYICDGWRLGFSGAMVPQASVGLLGVFSALGFPSALFSGIATAQASLGVSDYIQIYNCIEGYRIARLAWGTANAQPITISFWSGHHRTGIYSVVVRNGAGGTRTYASTYTHNVADVAQYNTITIPGDTSGTWATDNTMGMVIEFCAGCGANYIAPSANAWTAGTYIAAPGQINAVAATSDIFRITGVTVLPGNEAPSAARSPFVMRSYGQELAVCQRYLTVIGVAGTNFPVFGITNNVVITFPMGPMRAAPTVTSPWADGNYQNAPPPTTPQTWSLLLPGVAYVTRTGTISFGAFAGPGFAALNLTGMTFSNNSTTLQSAPVMPPVILDARL